MCGLGNQIIAQAHHLRAFNHARDRIALSLKMTGGSSGEATTNITSHFQDLQFSVASLGLLPVILNGIKYYDRQEGMHATLSLTQL